jgi:hypothetical protein
MTTTESAQARNEAQLRQLIAGQPLPHCAASQRAGAFIKLQSEQTHLRPATMVALKGRGPSKCAASRFPRRARNGVPARPTVGCGFARGLYMCVSRLSIMLSRTSSRISGTWITRRVFGGW